jgi:hypothetical protein
MSKASEVFMAYSPSPGRLAILRGYAIRTIGFLALFEKRISEDPGTVLGASISAIVTKRQSAF